MRKSILSVIIIVNSIVFNAVCQESIKPPNYSTWSVERLGKRFRIYTPQEIIAPKDDITICFQEKAEDNIKKTNEIHYRPIFSLNEADAKLVDIETGQRILLRDKRAFNPFESKHGGIAPYSLVEEEKDYKIPLGIYKFIIYEFVESKDGKTLAILEIPPIEIKCTGELKEKDTDQMSEETKLASFDHYWRDPVLEKEVPWSDDAFGLQAKSYLKMFPYKNDPKMKSIYLHIMLKNNSNKTIAIEYGGLSGAEEVWDLNLKNRTTGEISYPTSFAGLFLQYYAMGIKTPDNEWWVKRHPEIKWEKAIYWGKKLEPQEEYHQVIRILGGIGFCNGPFNNGNVTLTSKIRVYYSPDGIYNAATTEGQEKLLKTLQMKELDIPPVNFTVDFFPDTIEEIEFD
jgi:hypothetical protein